MLLRIIATEKVYHEYLVEAETIDNFHANEFEYIKSYQEEVLDREIESITIEEN